MTARIVGNFLVAVRDKVGIDYANMHVIGEPTSHFQLLNILYMCVIGFLLLVKQVVRNKYTAGLLIIAGMSLGAQASGLIGNWVSQKVPGDHHMQYCFLLFHVAV
jgi:hypothetical protein